MKKITHSRLIEVLNYDPLTGIFTWKVSPKHRAGVRKPGDTAGGLHWKGYVSIWVDGGEYRAHRLAWFYMTGAWPINQIDHRNGLKADNVFDNLREATNGQNRANSKPNKRKDSLPKGVIRSKDKKKFVAQIHVGKKNYHLGTFEMPEEAFGAYVRAAKRFHGEFARF